MGIMESCALLTAPVEVPVVAEAKRAEAAMPKRVSLPSMLPPDWVAVAPASTLAEAVSGLPPCSLTKATAARAANKISIAAMSA